MVETHGLSHVSLAVRDPQRSLEFYSQAFGVREYFRDHDQIQVKGPGPFTCWHSNAPPRRRAPPAASPTSGFA